MAVSDLSNAATGRPRRSGTLALPLVGMLILAAIAAGFIAYVLWPRWPGPTVPPDAPALPITIAGTPFNVPPAAMRVSLQRRAGAHDRVDLAFLWPSHEPPDSGASGAHAPGVAAQQTVERVFVTITAAGDALAPAERIKTIYPRYAAADAAIEPNGLAVKAFRSGTPYQGEDLIYDSIYDSTTPEGFLVRCSRNSAGPTPGICLYSQRIDHADIVVRFPRDWLT
ncbi:MAG TPA: hypothetical protein VGH84_08390, partial [Steroidobacteraceae bacterium]